jgi:hypothetical protein
LHPLQLADEVAKALVLVLQALPFGALGGKFRAHRQCELSCKRHFYPADAGFAGSPEHRSDHGQRFGRADAVKPAAAAGGGAQCQA